MNTIIDHPVLINNEGAPVNHPSVEPTATIELNLDQLRLLSKSISKTRDAELKKLGRLKVDTPLRKEVATDYATLSEIDIELQNAIDDVVSA